MTVKIAICGPNLIDQSKGQFHIHSAGCADLKHYGHGRRQGGDDQGWIVEVEDDKPVAYQASRLVYEDHVTDYGWTEEANPDECREYWESITCDFHVFPCVNGANTTTTNTKGNTNMSSTTTTEKPAKVKAEKAAKAPAEVKACACGCGETVAAKRRFRPGHDARLKGYLLKDLRSGDTVKIAAATERSAAEGWGYLVEQAAKVAPKRVKAPKAPKAAKSKFSEVKIGRWTHEVVKILEAVGSDFKILYKNKQGKEIEAVVSAAQLS